jgi:transposase
MDNAAVHRAEGVNEWAASKQIKLLTLPPYSPELNPAEKIISSIKAKVKKARYNFH